jgi:O-antigen/teichoic acid export membrane protein
MPTAGARRAGWSGIDQALFSLTNVALSVAVAHRVSASEFGAFSIAYLVYILVSNAGRAVASEPLIVRFAAKERREVLDAARDSTGFALVFGSAIAVCTAGVATLFSGSVAGGLYGLAIFLPGILLQDTYRFVFFTEGKPQQAALNDGICAVALTIGLGAVLISGTHSVFLFVLAWGGATVVAAVAGIVQTGVVPCPRRAFTWFRENQALASGFLADFVLLIAASQIGYFAVGIIAGLNQLGGLRAANVLMGPITTVLTAARVVVLPEAVRARDESLRRFRKVISALALLMAGATALIGLLLCLVPRSIGRAVLGPSWVVGRPLLPYVALGTVAVGLNLGAVVGLRVLKAPRQIVTARGIMTVFVLLGGVGGAWVNGAMGSAIGNAAANFAGVAIWLAFLRKSYLEAERAETEQPDFERFQLVPPLP